MSRIARSTQQIFGAAGNVGTGGFGAAANGVLTTELATSSSLSTLQTGQSGMWAGGWLGAVLGSTKFPPLEDMNAINYVVTTQLAYILQQGIAEYDAGTTYYVNNVVMNPGTYQLYGSKINSNTGNALSNTSDWQFLGDLSQIAADANFFVGGTSTGSANAQVVATLNPSGYAQINGATVSFTAGFTNTTSTQFNFAGTGLTTVYKWNGSAYVVLTGGEVTATETIFATYNSTIPGYVLTEGPALGQAANKSVTDNTKSTVASVTGSFVVGNVKVAADTAGTDKDGGTAVRLKLTGNANYYVATTGNDSNVGSIGSPWLTLQHAINVIQTTIDFAGFSVIINVGAGTFNGDAQVFGVSVGGTDTGDSGVQPIQIVGAGSGSTTLNCPASSVCLQAFNGGIFSFSALTLTGGSNAFGLNSQGGGSLIYIGTDVIFGAFSGSSSAHITATYGGRITNKASTYTISGNAGYHYSLGEMGLIELSPSSITLTGTPAFTCFANVGDLSHLTVESGGAPITFTGSATGVRYNVFNNGVCVTAGGGANYFPGNSAGSTSVGGVYV